MRIYLITLFIFLANSSGKAQSFSCSELMANTSHFNELKKEMDLFEIDELFFSKELSNKYSLSNDGYIYHKYVIISDKEINKYYIFDKTLNYLKSIFSDNKGSVDKTNKSSGLIKANYTFYHIGEIKDVLTKNYVNAKMFITIKINENNIFIETYFKKYDVGSYALYTLSPKNETSNIIDAYPINKKSNHKVSYARAFINCHNSIFCFTNNYLTYLNNLI